MPSPSWAGFARNRADCCAQARETPRQYVKRESHYLWGRRYLLTVVEAGRQAFGAARPPAHLSHRAPWQHAGETRRGDAGMASIRAPCGGAGVDPQWEPGSG